MDAYNVLEELGADTQINERDFNKIKIDFQNSYLKTKRYEERIKKHRRPIEVKNEVLHHLYTYLQQICNRPEMRDIDEEKNSSGYVTTKIGEIWKSDKNIKTCYNSIAEYCLLRSKNFNLIAVHIAECRAMNKLATLIKNSIGKDNKPKIMNNKITTVTRRNIADALTTSNLSYSGRLREADFLNRLYDLKKMSSTDYRPEYDTAYKDVLQHADNNPGDWQPDWIFTDERFNLMHCSDDEYLKFLIETLSPHVRPDNDDTEKMLIIHNKYLSTDGFQLYKSDEISGKPVFNWTKENSGYTQLAAKATEIKRYLNTEYVSKKIEQMNKAILTDTDVALGTGKELLEVTCKSILKAKCITTDKAWYLSQLLKATTNALDFKPKEADDPEAAERSIKQILGGISSIVQGITELRNAYGSGHGKDADFKGLESKYAKLFVGVVAEIAIIYLATNGETEIVSDSEDANLF
ncbi:MAG TPA: abortive infection family protein [Mucilaginibacter sp.]